MDPSAALTVLDVVLMLVWNCLCTTPDSQKHPIYRKLFLTHDVLYALCETVALAFAPGLFEVLQASEAPSVAYFKSLPTNCQNQWVVYLLVLEKSVYRPKIYIGSATDAKHGAPLRLGQYDRGVLLPRHVEKALKDGYTIVHKGILCWAPIPSAALVPILRMLILAVEAAFTFVFWAMNCKTDYGFGMTQLCPWARDSLEYDGLCTHSPLTDPPAGDHSLSAEQLEAQAAEMMQRRTDYMREWRERTKREDPEKYRLRANDNAARWRKNNPGSFKATNQRSIAKAVNEKKHYCAICDHAFTKKAKLRKHLKGPKHAAKAEAVNGKKKNYCAICDHTYATTGSFNRHLREPTHAAKAARNRDSK